MRIRACKYFRFSVRMLLTARYHISILFGVFVWTGENYLNTQRVDADFFKNRRKYICFQNIGYVWTGHHSVVLVFTGIWSKVKRETVLQYTL